MSEQAGGDSALAEPGTWVVDPASSYVRFELHRLWGLLKVKAEFARFAGAMVVDLDSVSLDLTIDASSVSTKNETIDKHLRSRDFFDVEHHPTIQFEADTVEPTVFGWIITGDLAIGDAGLRLKLPVTVYEDIDQLTALMHDTTSCRGGLNWKRLGMAGSRVVVRIELALAKEAYGSSRRLLSAGDDHARLVSST